MQKCKNKEPLANDLLCEKRNAPLSSEQVEKTNLRGLINLGVIFFCITNFRLLFENFQYYGLLVEFQVIQLVLMKADYILYLVVVLAVWLALVLAAYIVQRACLQGMCTETVCFYSNVVVITTSVIIPQVIVQVFTMTPFLNLQYLGYSLVLTFKLISLAHVVRDIKRLQVDLVTRCGDLQQVKDVRQRVDEHIVNQQNLKVVWQHRHQPEHLVSLQHMFYFALAPTLCFQLQYPRSAHIRISYLLNKVVELVFCLLLFSCIYEQYVAPVLTTIATLQAQGQSIYLLQILFSLTIPCTVLWILNFVIFFHLELNIIAEVLQFGDRLFYKDWWNCTSQTQFWRQWNLPIHHWFTRHVYASIRHYSNSRKFTILSVMFISAVFHEYIISGSIKKLSFVCFYCFNLNGFAMILEQDYLIDVFIHLYPFQMIGDSQIGNVYFWLLYIIIGQPMCMYSYYYFYITSNRT